MKRHRIWDLRGKDYLDQLRPFYPFIMLTLRLSKC